MTHAIKILLALSFVLTAGCLDDTRLRNNPGGAYVPDAPAEEVIEDEDINDDEQVEDEDEQIEDEEEIEEEIETSFEDNDTFDDPLFTYSFLGSGTQDNFAVADDVSAPFGDVHDWVGFTTPAPQNSLVNVTLTLDCDSDDLRAQLFEDTNSGPLALGASYQVSCGETDTFLIPINSDYLVRIHFPQGTDEQRIVDWELAVSW
ncbi:MAG: hypothetical protein KDA24_01040 [Deltaproteobacteria bacterium]|nr:hypothetical protein [Deltaproteobacteria bacterium]